MDGQTKDKGNGLQVQRNKTRLKEQFINGINDQTMIAETIREQTVIKDTSEITSE